MLLSAGGLCIMASACRFRTSSLFNYKTSWEPDFLDVFWSFRFVLVRFRVSRCFLAQVVCALWRLLADSAQVPFSTAGPLESNNFGYFLNHVGKSLFRALFSHASWMFLGTGGLCIMASACGFHTSSLFNRRTTREP